MSAGESRVEDSPPPLVFRPIHCHLIFLPCQRPYILWDSLGLRQRVLHSDLVCNFWVDDGADWIAEGLDIEVENIREVVLSAEVVHHNVWMAVVRQILHELAHRWEVVEPEAEAWLWLRYISWVLEIDTGVSLTYQSIAGASISVEFNGKLYNGASEKYEQCSQNIGWVQKIHGLHSVGCTGCSDVVI